MKETGAIFSTTDEPNDMQSISLCPFGFFLSPVFGAGHTLLA